MHEVQIFIRQRHAYPDMARRGRRKFRRYIRGNIDVTQLLGTLAAETGILATVPDTLTEKAWISSVKATYALKNMTPGGTSGPLSFGVAHGDYTLSEITSWIELTSSWKEGNKVEQEIGARKIRRIGTFESPSGPTDTARFNDGRPVTTKINWMLITGQTLKFWVYNEGSGALATTDPSFHVNGHANIWPN